MEAMQCTLVTMESPMLVTNLSKPMPIEHCHDWFFGIVVETAHEADDLHASFAANDMHLFVSRTALVKRRAPQAIISVPYL